MHGIDRPARLPLCVRCVDKKPFQFCFYKDVFKRFFFCDATALLNGVYLDCEREFSNILNGGFLEAD